MLTNILTFMAELTLVRFVALGYLAYVLIGWLLLCLPFAHADKFIPALDNLFTSVSALSTTGLVTTSTGSDYSIWGQLIILLLIQIGGVGYMTFGSFVVLSHSDSISYLRKDITKTVFSLPADIQIEHFVRCVIVFTIVIETIGSIALYFAFSAAGVQSPLWPAIFHSVSAFCTAGFSLYDNSMESFRMNVPVNCIVGCLSYLGAIGFIVALDAWKSLTRRSVRMTLTSKVILVSTLWLSIIGTVLFFLGEPAIRGSPFKDRLMTSFFQVMTALTTVGFNSIPIGRLSQASLFLIIMLMVIGASPSGTGGGLKTTTFSTVIGVVRSASKGLDRVYYWGREIPPQRVWVAFASLGFYIFFVIAGCYALSFFENFGFEAILFEVSSALGTVGLSTGITASLSPIGKLVIVFLMFIGRLGPLAFGMSLLMNKIKTKAMIKMFDDLAV